MTPTRHPLHWPTGWKRFAPVQRKEATFTRYKKALTVYDGVQRVLLELERMGIHEADVIVSTDVRTRLDGLPRSGEPKPDDPGAAVYWQPPVGAMRCMAIDRYDEVADNLAAIAATLEAMRAIERHGGAAILDRAFAGFEALPAPGAKREWWEVLRVSRDSSREEVRRAYRLLASAAHPDKPGGSHERMAELNAAQDAALRECLQ